jgi:hypothetical protein
MFSPVAGRLQKENPSLRNDKTALYVTTENCAFPSIMAIKMIRKNLYKNLKILACFFKKLCPLGSKIRGLRGTLNK